MSRIIDKKNPSHNAQSFVRPGPIPPESRILKEPTSMNTVTLTLPDRVLSILRRPSEEIVQILRVTAAIHWYERGVLSQDKALEISGLARAEFFSALGLDEGGDAAEP
jgi:uncharacterized protein UPF0175